MFVCLFLKQHWELTCYFQKEQMQGRKQRDECAIDSQVTETTVKYRLPPTLDFPPTLGLYHCGSYKPTSRVLTLNLREKIGDTSVNSQLSLSFCLVTSVPWIPASSICSFTDSSSPLLKPLPFIRSQLSQQAPAPWHDEWGGDNVAAGQKYCGLSAACYLRESTVCNHRSVWI